MMPITASVSNSGRLQCAASGNRYSPKRSKPYVPSFSITPARITEPAVGAWVCASGSQVCSGKIGTFTANAMANAKNSQRPVRRREVGVLGDLDEVERDVADAVAAGEERRWR